METCQTARLQFSKAAPRFNNQELCRLANSPPISDPAFIRTAWQEALAANDYPYLEFLASSPVAEKTLLPLDRTLCPTVRSCLTGLRYAITKDNPRLFACFASLPSIHQEFFNRAVIPFALSRKRLDYIERLAKPPREASATLSFTLFYLTAHDNLPLLKELLAQPFMSQALSQNRAISKNALQFAVRKRMVDFVDTLVAPQRTV